MKIIKLLVLFGALFFVSCEPSGRCIKEAYLEDDFVVVVLNNKYRIGDINCGCVGELEFVKYYNNFEVNKTSDTVLVKIKNEIIESDYKDSEYIITRTGEQIHFKDGEDYSIGVEWFRGNVRTWATFRDGRFVPLGYEDYEAHGFH